jgi:hypothetical protein
VGKYIEIGKVIDHGVANSKAAEEEKRERGGKGTPPGLS